MAYLTYDEWNKKLDDYLVEVNKKSGEITNPCVGLYPPVAPDAFHTVDEMSVNNKLASADLIRHYADAIGDTNPLWRFDEYAKNTKYGTIIAPPHFIDCIAPTYGALGDVSRIFYVEGMVP